jgi:hypothetical protein
MDMEIASEESGGAFDISTRVDVYFLPEFYGNTRHAGKSHLGVPRRKAGTLSHSADMERAVRMFATEAGAYFAELKDGRDVIDHRVIEAKSRAQNIELDSVPTPAPPQDALARVLDGISQRLEGLESERSAARRRGRVENRARVRRRFQAPMPREADMLQQPTISEVLERERARDREVLALSIENAELRLKQAAPQAEKSSPDLSGLLSQVLVAKVASGDDDVTDRLIDRVLGNDADEKSGGFFGLVEKLVDNADKIPSVLASLGMLAQPAPLQPPQHAPAPRPVSSAPPPQQNASTTKQAQTDEPPNFEHEASVVFTNTLADMSAGKPARASARDLVSLFREFPQESAALRAQLAFPSEVILQSIATGYPSHASIVTQPGAVEWMNQLQAEIAKRRAPKAKAAASDALLSGNGSHAEAVAS